MKGWRSGKSGNGESRNGKSGSRQAESSVSESETAESRQVDSRQAESSVSESETAENRGIRSRKFGRRKSGSKESGGRKSKWRLVAGVLLGCLLALAGVFGFFYLQLQPEHHFRTAGIPVLSVPQPSALSPANAGGEQQDNDAGAAGGAGGLGLPGGGGAAAGDGSGTALGAAPGDAASAASSAAGSVADQQEKLAFNMLLLGIDARENEDSRTDVMMLAHVNLSRGIVNLVSIPRDTRVNLPGVGYTKINHAHILGELKGGGQGGTQAALQAVSNFSGVPINYYVKTNFDGFVHFIDAIGGIDVQLEHPVKLTYIYKTLPAGKQHLDGDLTLNLVRERHSLTAGDTGRQQNQALVLKAVFAKMLQPANLVKIPDLLKVIRQDILDTNLSDSDMISLSLLAKDLNSEDIGYEQVPGHNGRAKDPLVGKELDYWIPDQTAWENLAKKVLEE